MSARSEAESLLLAAAASHGLDLEPVEIRAALADGHAGADLASWATSNLGSDNLLTIDELALYTALDKSGQVDRLASLHDLASLPSLRSSDVRAAVDELRRSTHAVTEQAETLRHQRDALARLVANRAATQAKRRELEAAQQRTSASERVRVSSEMTEIAHGLEFRIAQLKHDDDGGGGTALHQALDVILHADDALLTSLQKLGRELREPDPEEAKSTDKLRETCLRLIKITVETIRTRLDTTYLSALATAAQSQSSHSNADHDEVDALQAELESLYAEILPVAQMTVEQQHLDPALRSIAARSGQTLRKTASALAYMERCFDYLLSRINALHAHTELYNAHHGAVNRVVATARQEMAYEPPAPEPQPSIETPSPMKPPARTKRSSRDMSHCRRSSGLPDVSAVDGLIQSLALPMEAHGDGSGTPSQIAALSKLLCERRSKESGAARSAQDEFETLTAERLDDARRAVQRLRDSLLAETPFGALQQLADPGIEQSVGVLAHEVDKARGKLARCEGEGRGFGSLKRDEFVERWAR